MNIYSFPPGNILVTALFDKCYFFLKQLKIREFCKNTNVFRFKMAENFVMHKTCLTSQFQRLILARFFRESKCAILMENLANKSLRNCDVRQVLCLWVLNPKNYAKPLLTKLSSFQLFQSKLILVKCCKEVSAPVESVFFRIPCLSRNIFVFKFVYIFRTDENSSGSCQLFVIIYIYMITTL